MKTKETFRPILMQFFEGEWRLHIEDGFKLIESIPSGSAKYFARHIRSLPESDRDGLIADLIVRGAEFFLPTGAGSFSIGPRLRAYFDNKNEHGHGHEFMGIHFKKAILASERDEALRHISAEAYEKALTSLEPARAPELRKLLKPLLETAGYRHLDHGGGAWRYEKQLSGIPCLLLVDFPGRGRQIEYDLKIGPQHNRLPSSGVSYENLFGFSQLGWDQVNKSVSTGAMSLMMELVSRVEGLMAKAVEHLEMNA